ncbi:serine hydrolase [Alteromonas sp. ASW11-36]|uniref:Serine hydrolase n=1 Tax=Alteromonas arenosi TaxID=3055817 RepID=A0ABT7T039_9ALTE|nr:serine hydrolase [Alteromonas sp. ASW11-36]MDM7861765.1 serine hydrolase [Alteromonas sp. ASW11-36]
MTIKRALKVSFIALALALIIGAWFYSSNIIRLYTAITLYDEDKIADNFISMPQAFNATTLQPSSKPYRFPQAHAPFDDELAFAVDDSQETISTFLRASRTTSLLVLHDGKIVYEYYGETGAKNQPHISFSVAKSFVSALIGIAVEQGLIADLEQPITDYVPELIGTGYDAVPIKDILQMSSGVHFNEDYADFNSDINRFSRAIAFGTSLDDFSASLKSTRAPGEYHKYVSIDTQVLGMLLVRVTNMSLTEYAQIHLWEPLGMQDTAYWLSDDQGMELALGGLNITARDYAKFGWMYANKGRFNGVQIVPEQWVTASVTADAPHLQPGDNPNSNSRYGYGYQWWLPVGRDDEFMAQGIYHQYIYIDPDAAVVIVKTSANHAYNDYQQRWAARHLAMFRALVSHYSD